ncbi:TPA: hypothetical protein HA235_06575 [Candidatus Woesearchaeota archaeon]|nr:hypothetical protein [Candidatus Woesearchaeota archaeon]HIH32341.1 hypothetical protein [Candidatus Woesearchaeota archaeon]HIH55161.1 hypothetical protein [Candidatus Woesearchaeota archaeon]HIJ13379.1 hypothetical protein [Candidatus Woesearchaeota archaeon]
MAKQKNTKKQKKSKTNLDGSAKSQAKFSKISNEKKEAIGNVVRELVAEEAIQIVLYLIGKTKVSEFTVANDLDMEIHKARNLLYRLYEQNILSFIRKKDKIKGWYICYWDFNEKSIPFLSIKIKQQKLAKLQDRLEKESNSTFYMCKSACTRMDFERAMEFNFKCPECGELMDEQNNARTLEFLKEKIKELKK